MAYESASNSFYDDSVAESEDYDYMEDDDEYYDDSFYEDDDDDTYEDAQKSRSRTPIRPSIRRRRRTTVVDHRSRGRQDAPVKPNKVRTGFKRAEHAVSNIKKKNTSDHYDKLYMLLLPLIGSQSSITETREFSVIKNGSPGTETITVVTGVRKNILNQVVFISSVLLRKRLGVSFLPGIVAAGITMFPNFLSDLEEKFSTINRDSALLRSKADEKTSEFVFDAKTVLVLVGGLLLYFKENRPKNNNLMRRGRNFN